MTYCAGALAACIQCFCRVRTRTDGYSRRQSCLKYGTVHCCLACAVQLVRQYDVIVDATDNAPTRYLIRQVAVAAVLFREPLYFSGWQCVTHVV